MINAHQANRVRELYSLCWSTSQIVDETGIEQLVVEQYQPDPELHGLQADQIAIQDQLNTASQSLSDAVETTLSARNELVPINILLAGIQREKERLSDLLVRTRKDEKRTLKQLQAAQNAVQEAERESLSIQQQIDGLNENMETAQAGLDAYHEKARLDKIQTGIAAHKQRTATEIAQLAIEAAVGDKIEKILRDKL